MKRQLPEFKFKNVERVEYKIIWKAPYKKYSADGLCDDPKSLKPKIWINPALEEKRLLEVITEEILHSFMFEKNEKTVRKFASVLKRLLYKMGWRKS